MVAANLKLAEVFEKLSLKRKATTEDLNEEPPKLLKAGEEFISSRTHREDTCLIEYTEAPAGNIEKPHFDKPDYMQHNFWSRSRRQFRPRKIRSTDTKSGELIEVPIFGSHKKPGDEDFHRSIKVDIISSRDEDQVDRAVVAGS